ncbi:MAG: hypothetical protein ACQGVK_16635 [Myxococcota bacterium]
MNWRHAASSVLGFFAAGAGHAGPPLLTDDPVPAAPRTLESILTFTVERRASGQWYQLPLLDLSYGLVPDLEVGALVPWYVSDEPGTGSDTGFGHLAAHAKWRFWKTSDATLQAAAAPALLFDTAESDVDRGASQDGFTLLAPLLAQSSIAGFDVGLDLTFLWRPTGPDVWLTGLAVSREVFGGASLLAELTTESGHDLSDTDVAFTAGLHWAVHQRLHLLASWGRRVRRGSDDRLHWRAYVGLQLISGPFGRRRDPTAERRGRPGGGR